jgi:E3 ubiquitin-protein ligase HECTD2
VSFGEYNEVVTVPLMENAHRVPVTNANRNEFVRLYLDWILNKGIYEKFRAFYLGFHSVCASNALIVSPKVIFFYLKENVFLKII